MKKNILFFLFSFIFVYALYKLDPKGAIGLDFETLHLSWPLALFFSVALSLLAILCFMNYFTEKLSSNIHHTKPKDKDRLHCALSALLKTMTSTTEGDMKSARKYLKELKDEIGQNVIIDVLTLKILKGEKKFDEVEKLSSKLLNDDHTELVGLKALVETSDRAKKYDRALASVNRAFEARQDLYWVIENAFLLRAKTDDWVGAVEVLDAGLSKKIISKEKFARLKAITLYECAQKERKAGHDLIFEKCMSEVLSLCPTFIPAAICLAEFYQERGRKNKAIKILKEIWRLNPCYEVAQLYLDLFKEDTLPEKIVRMENLALLNAKEPSLNNLLLADLSVKAKLWDKAKAEFEIFLINNPATKKLAKLIETYEKQKNKNNKAALNWKSRAKNCAEDNVFVCSKCGQIHKKWKPFCSKCNSFDSLTWQLYADKKGKK